MTAPRRDVTLYARDEGPIGYEVPLLDEDDVGRLAGFYEELLRSGLAWYWESARSVPEPSGPEPAAPLPHRPPTRLTPETLDDLRLDLRERSEEHARVLALFGADPETAESIERTGIRVALARFCAREEGPVQLAVLLGGDSPRETVFCRHRPSPAAGELLRRWGLAPEAARKTRKYRHLRAATPEAVYGLGGPAPAGALGSLPLTPPVVVDEHGDVSLFRTREHAERCLEAIDVRSGEYVAFDAEGRLLGLHVVEERRRSFFGLLGGVVETVRIEPAEAEPGHREELRRLLTAFLSRVDPPEEVRADTGLDELMAAVMRRTGYTA